MDENTKQTLTTEETKPWQIALGLFLIIVMVWGLYLAISKAIRWIWPPSPPTASLALSATFDTNGLSSGELRIRGKVNLITTNWQSAWVKIILDAPNRKFRQTDLVALSETNQTFDLRAEEFPALAKLRRFEPLLITAEVLESGKVKVLGREEIYLNWERPIVSLRALGWLVSGLVLLGLGIFLYAFTGMTGEPGSKKMNRKNQTAISFSYLVIIVWLLLPIVVPIALPHMFPNLLDLVAEKPTPVGLVVTRTAGPNATENGSAAKNLDPEWALHIGGFVVITNSEANSLLQQEGRPNTEVVVKGGLVIPLWVLILALIGGAINMTMKVPHYQREMQEEVAEAQKKNADSLLKQGVSVATAAFNIVGTVVDAIRSTPKSDTAAETPAPPPAPEASRPKSPPAPKPSLPTPVKHAEETHEKLHWRQGLLGLYMSLVSAPFLAIVTYYLLRWGNLVTVPVLVVVSFSIGLMSERIVLTLTNLAGNVLSQTGRPKPDAPPGK